MSFQDDTWDYIIRTDQLSTYVSNEPGTFQTRHLTRNGGPAVAFSGADVDVVVTMDTTEELIGLFQNILNRLRAEADTTPDAKCRNCGHAITFPNVLDAPQWVHRPWVHGQHEWLYECVDEDGDPIDLDLKLVAQPASDPERVAVAGDQVIDMQAVENEQDEWAVARVWEHQYTGSGVQIALDNDHVRSADQLLVIERYEA